jgi:hypothetical protein
VSLSPKSSVRFAKDHNRSLPCATMLLVVGLIMGTRLWCASILAHFQPPKISDMHHSVHLSWNAGMRCGMPIWTMTQPLSFALTPSRERLGSEASCWSLRQCHRSQRQLQHQHQLQLQHQHRLRLRLRLRLWPQLRPIWPLHRGHNPTHRVCTRSTPLLLAEAPRRYRTMQTTAALRSPEL